MVNSGSVGTPATVVLRQSGVTHTVHTYEHDPSALSFGAEAAQLLGVEPERVFKTLVADTGDSLVVGVVPVTLSLDLKALAKVLGAKKLVMADPPSAERSSGMLVGGISPVGQKRALPTVLDSSMLLHETIFVSGGRRGLDVELAPADLAHLTNATVAPISR